MEGDLRVKETAAADLRGLKKNSEIHGSKDHLPTNIESMRTGYGDGSKPDLHARETFTRILDGTDMASSQIN